MIYIIPTDTCFWIWCKIYDESSYKEIYALKNRSLDKPLAIMVENIEFLKKHTHISDMQVHFLLEYKRPYTVLLSTKTNFISENIPNKSLYKKTAFRVANMQLQKNLLGKIGPIFLTSANISGENEIYSKKDLPFHPSENLTIYGESDIEKVPPSDIFEFIGDGVKIVYLRKS